MAFIKAFAVALFAATAFAAAPSTQPASGVYQRQGSGQPGKLLTTNLAKAALRSISNDNTRFQLDLAGVGPIAKRDEAGLLLVVVDSAALPVWSQSDRHPDGTINLGVAVADADTAARIEKALQIQATRRTDPGHRLRLTCQPHKQSYRIGEPIELRIQITNVGQSDVTFHVGGQQRGPRDNQFRFLAYGSSGYGKAVPDTGDPTNFGGLGGHKHLNPGEVFETGASLDKWFKFDKPGTYQVTAIFELELYKSENGLTKIGDREIWDDLAVGECMVTIVE